MKRWLMLLAAAVMVTVTVRAGDEAKAAKPDAPKMACGMAQSSCDDLLAKLTLTDEQKQKIAVLKEECGKIGCPVTARAKCLKGLSGILTAEQFAQVKAASGKSEGCCAAAKPAADAKAAEAPKAE